MPIQQRNRRSDEPKEEEFVVPATDHMGRSETITFRALPAHARAGEAIMYSRRFPFKTAGDCFRWCLYWGLRRLEEHEPDSTAGYVIASDMEIMRMRAEMYAGQVGRHVDTLGKLVETYLKMGSRAGKMKAALTVMEALANTKKARPSVWRKKALQDIKSKYGYLLKIKELQSISLHPDEWEEEDDEEGETGETGGTTNGGEPSPDDGSETGEAG